MKQKQVDSWGLLVSQPSLLGEPRDCYKQKQTNKQKKVAVPEEADSGCLSTCTHTARTHLNRSAHKCDDAAGAHLSPSGQAKVNH